MIILPFDTETTGVDFTKSQVIQAGCVFTDENLNVLGKQEWNINYEDHFEWTKGAENVHHITKETAKTHGISAEEFCIEFTEALKSFYGSKYNPRNIRLTGAQSYFDYVMVQQSLWNRFNKPRSMPVSYRLKDINCMADDLIGITGLNDILEYFGIASDQGQRHSALYDAEKHYEAYVCLKRRLDEMQEAFSLLTRQVLSVKKNILIVGGFGDTFFHPESHRFIPKRGQEMHDRIMEIVEESRHDFFGVVRLNDTYDQTEKINFDSIEDFPATRVIDLKLCSSSVFNINNQITVTGKEGTETVLDGCQLDHVLPPEEYDIFVAGVDINGIFISLLDEMHRRGYRITVFSDIIKPYNKNTITHIKNSKAKFGKS